MKLIPNKGHIILKRTTAPADSGTLAPPADSDKVYEVVAVSQDSPLCKVGDTIVMLEPLTQVNSYIIGLEADVMAWVETRDVV
jgi:hypothetical protein